MWPASALLTGNGVAFVLRVPGTPHGDWWSLKGWWIFAGTRGGLAALEVRDQVARRAHLQPVEHRARRSASSILGRGRADPLDFWWGPMSGGSALALAIIVAGGFLILCAPQAAAGRARRSGLTFAAGIGVLALAGHAMTGALAPRPDHRLPLLVGARHLAGGARLPLLHDHRPEDGAARRRAPDRLRGLARPARVAADRADDDGVREQGGAARVARDRLRSPCRCCAAGPCRSTGGSRWWRPRSCSPRFAGVIAFVEHDGAPRRCAPLPPGCAAADHDPAVAGRADASSTSTRRS